MKRKLFPILLMALVLLALVPLTAAQDATAEATAMGALIPVRLQLKWVTQAQFGGYYAAQEQGYWKDEGLDVTILPGGPDVNNEQVVASGGAEFGIDWMGSMLASREGGSGSVNIAQIYTRSGMRELTWKDSGLTTIPDLKGKTVGVWGFGNQFPLFAALVKNNIDPNNPDDITIFNQPFDMTDFLGRKIDAAAAMTYNEMAQVFETVGDDGKFPLYTADDVNIIDLNEVGTAMLEDLIFANEKWLAGKTGDVSNEEIAIKFLRGAFRGWAYARDNVDTTVDDVLAAGSTLGKGHQLWEMNEVNKLIWPNDKGIGILDADELKTTEDIALTYKVISKAPDATATRTDLAQAALDSLLADHPDFDATGKDYKPETVAITAKGD